MGGDIKARHNLGAIRWRDGNMEALKHFMIAVWCGDNNSLENIKQMFMNGEAMKDDYEKALQAASISSTLE